MCGRFVRTAGDGDLIDAFSIHQVFGTELGASWNVAPGQEARVVLERYAEAGEPRRQLRSLRWGLVPSWAREPSIGNRAINARSETVLERPSFWEAASRRRCLVPANGYYEWQALPHGGKQAYYLHAGGTPARGKPHSADQPGPLLAFAGVYEAWRDPARDREDPARWLRTFAILTRPATDAVGTIHERSPVVVPPGLREAWLAPDLTAPREIQDLLATIPDPHLVPRPVSPAVGDVRNDGPRLLAETEPAYQAPLV